ncbi:hypothetical protein COB64_02785 [Candidatus Wolfebacteria bacterium]|nr:MAG: hypothetical protein COB64_02785 [Candidatus Wolfebacteria bacterium]
MDYTHSQSNSIFWIDVDKIKPNPYQPRREFDQARLQDLSDSIRQYGVLQPVVVSRIEVEKGDGGIVTEYELIAGERRLRASKLAGLSQIPSLIRTGDDSRLKLEIAIIENLQREDLNSADRAKAFERLAKEFKFTHAQIAQKVGKSREYVSNTLRLLTLSDEILSALSQGKISEGHTRPIMMLNGRPEEQQTLFKEILFRKITVREAERIARGIATDKIRKKELMPDPHIKEIQNKFEEALGTRVHINRKEKGGNITIDYFSSEDLEKILALIKSDEKKKSTDMINKYISSNDETVSETPIDPTQLIGDELNKSNEVSDDLHSDITIVEPTPDPTQATNDESVIETSTDTDQLITDDISKSSELSDDLYSDVSSVEPSQDSTQLTNDDLNNDLNTNADLLDDRSNDEIEKSEKDADLYNIQNFSI